MTALKLGYTITQITKIVVAHANLPVHTFIVIYILFVCVNDASMVYPFLFVKVGPIYWVEEGKEIGRTETCFRRI